MLRWILLTLLFLCPVAPAQDIEPTDAPFLWRIEGDTPSYLYGTIHVPDPRVLALPESVTEALAEAAALFTELPMDMESQMEMVQHLQLDEGRTLDMVLPKELYARVEAFVTKMGFPFMGFTRFKVWAITLTLPQLEQLRKSMAGGGGAGGGAVQALDAFLYNQAMTEGKEVGGLETIEEQIGIFDSTPEEDQVKGLSESLDQLEAGEEGVDPLEGLIEIYLSGDLDALVAALETDEGLGSDDPDMVELREQLITKRNVLMAERMAEHMTKQPETSFFFAVGCLHYPGEDGILTLLRAAGYEVTRVRELVGAPD